MVLWVGGMKYASASVAGVLSQMATVFTLLFGWWLLKEPMTTRKLMGAAAAVAGAVVIGALGG
jgi:drug/metabolite transporter (DMT)-like permease